MFHNHKVGKIENVFQFLFPEVVRAMTFLIDAGMVMYWGTARWSPFEIFESYAAVSTFPKVSNSGVQSL